MLQWMRALLLLAVCTEASALSVGVFTLEPDLVQSGEAVRLRVDSPQGCYRAESSSVSRDGLVVDVRFGMSDIANCLPQWITPIFTDIGSFGPGTYQVRISECGFTPLPCQVVATLPLQVNGTGSVRARTVPALSAGSGLALVSVLLIVGGLVARRSR